MLIYELQDLIGSKSRAPSFPVIALLIAVILAIIYRIAIHAIRGPSAKVRVPATIQSKTVERVPGIWPISDFKRPAASPYPNWDIKTTKPLPYRPFRYMPYHVTMGIRKMKWDDWIELDNEYPRYHKRKQERIHERGPMLSRTAPEAFDGACELLEEFCDYLPQRYPSLFRKTDVGMDNLYSGEIFNIVERPLAEDPMQMAARMVQDDLAIMFEKPDNQYYLLAGAVILPGMWRLKDKFGMVLSEVHTSGDVPQYKTKLEKGMMNFFRRIQPGDPVLRNNYFFQVGPDLAWNHSLGPENFDEVPDYNSEKQHSVKHHWSGVTTKSVIEQHYFRTERQSLRRLPRSGGVVFTFRTYFHPVTEIAQEPGVPGRLASAVRSWGPDVARYKGRERYQDVLLEYLDKKHKEQVEAGVINEEEELQKDVYPY